MKKPAPGSTRCRPWAPGRSNSRQRCDEQRHLSGWCTTRSHSSRRSALSEAANSSTIKTFLAQNDFALLSLLWVSPSSSFPFRCFWAVVAGQWATVILSGWMKVRKGWLGCVFAVYVWESLCSPGVSLNAKSGAFNLSVRNWSGWRRAINSGSFLLFVATTLCRFLLVLRSLNVEEESFAIAPSLSPVWLLPLGFFVFRAPHLLMYWRIWIVVVVRLCSWRWPRSPPPRACDACTSSIGMGFACITMCGCGLTPRSASSRTRSSCSGSSSRSSPSRPRWIPSGGSFVSLFLLELLGSVSLCRSVMSSTEVVCVGDLQR